MYRVFTRVTFKSQLHGSECQTVLAIFLIRSVPLFSRDQVKM